MKYITLPSGHQVKLDEEDYEQYSKFKWHLSNGYASRHRNDGSNTKIYLHRLIADTPDGLHTDHINGEKLDNQKANLRNVTASQNHMNRRKSMWKNSTSKLKGAQYHSHSGLWRSRIKVGDKNISLGYYKTELEAHEAYLAAAKEHFGEYTFIG